MISGAKYIPIFFLLLGTTTCAIRKDLETPFNNPVNQPIIKTGDDGDATHGTKFCAPDANGHFDGQSIPIQAGLNSSDGSGWAEGGACILRPIREVWAVLNNLEVMKFAGADSFTYQRTIHPRDNFTHLYEITYYKSTIIGPIDWTIQWYHGFDLGTFTDPQRVNIVYQRTRGTSNIPIWNGGIVLEKVNNGVTSIAIRNVFKARQSNSENVGSAQDGLKEIIGHTRDGTPDWGRLNTGLKDNPDAPDAPTGVTQAPSEFCVKDTNGHYPAQPDVASGANLGVSWLKVRACLGREAAQIYQALKDPVTLRWKNSSRAQLATNGGSDPSQLSVSYEIDRFLRSSIKWNMTWTYKASLRSDSSSDYLVTYKMDPASPDFPVWNGQISFHQLEDGVTSIEMDDQLLADTVSASLGDNVSNTTHLFQQLAGVATSSADEPAAE